MHVEPSRPASAETHPMEGRWELVGLLWVAFFLNQADRQVFNVVLPLIRDDLQLSDSQLGMVATTFTVVYGLLVPVAGILGDIFDRRRVVWLSLVVFSTGTLLTGFASSFLLLLIFRGLATGAGEAAYAPSAASLIGSAHNETRARALSLHQTANYTGIVLGSLLAAWVGQQFGWRWSFIVYGVAGLFWSIIFFYRARRLPILPPPRLPLHEQRALIAEAARLMFGQPLLVAQMLAFGGLVFVIVGFLTWAPTLLFERFGMSLVEAGFYSMFYHHLLAYAGVFCASWLTDRMIRRFPKIRLITMALGLIAAAPCLWWMAGATGLFDVYMALALFGLARGFYDAGLFAAPFDMVEDRLRSSVLGLLLAAGFLIGAASPLVMGLLKADYGLEGGLQLLAFVAAGAGMALLVNVLLAGRKLAPAGDQK